MVVPGVEVVTAPETTVRVLAWTLGGILLGTVSDLIPGIHANNFALVLAGVAPAVPGSPLFVGAAMLAAGVVHTFLNAVPAMALGVPDAETAVTALPGHRLVLDGRGAEAIRLSALGSLLAVVFAVPLALPLTWGVTRVYPTLQAHLSLVLAVVVLGLLASEPTWRRRLGATVSFGLAAALGTLTLDLSPSAPLDAGGVLAPLFAGLFGAPVLLDALRGGGVPPQTSAGIRLPRALVATTALAGALAGAVVGYVPGVTAAIAGVAVLVALPGGAGETSDRTYVVATSGVDTANVIFTLFALAAIGRPRSGVMVAFERVDAPLDLPVLVGSVLVAGVAGFVLVVVLGERYLRVVGRLPYWKVSATVLALLLVLSYLFTGVTGIAVFLAATAVGVVPVRLAVMRVHLMGVLLGPLLVGP